MKEKKHEQGLSFMRSVNKAVVAACGIFALSATSANAENVFQDAPHYVYVCQRDTGIQAMVSVRATFYNHATYQEVTEQRDILNRRVMGELAEAMQAHVEKFQQSGVVPHTHAVLFAAHFRGDLQQQLKEDAASSHISIRATISDPVIAQGCGFTANVDQQFQALRRIQHLQLIERGHIAWPMAPTTAFTAGVAGTPAKHPASP